MLFKFQAWDKQRNVMMPVKQMDWSEWWVSCNPIGVDKPLAFGERNSFNNEETDRHILRPFTGEKDKAGTEIWNGDIVLIDILDALHNSTFSEEAKRHLYKASLNIISFQNGAFGYYPAYPELNHEDDRRWRPFFDQDGDMWTKYMKVVGNIYENKGLIGGTE